MFKQLALQGWLYILSDNAFPYESNLFELQERNVCKALCLCGALKGWWEKIEQKFDINAFVFPWESLCLLIELVRSTQKTLYSQTFRDYYEAGGTTIFQYFNAFVSERNVSGGTQ